jgi:Flp pilus assembly protein TadG
MPNSDKSTRRRFVRNFLRLAADERGQELVEFAVVSVVILTCIFSIFYFSFLLYTYHFVAYAAREATRYGMVRGSTWGTTSCATTDTFVCNATSANVEAYVQSIVPPGISTGSALSVITTWPGTELAGSATTCNTTNGNNSPGCPVMVRVTYSFNYSMPFMPTTTLNLRSTSEVTIMR